MRFGGVYADDPYRNLLSFESAFMKKKLLEIYSRYQYNKIIGSKLNLKKINAYWWPGKNFGDLLSPILIQYWLNCTPTAVPGNSKGKLIGLGSILSSAQDGDIIWGSGCKGENIKLCNTKIISLRGPLTKDHAEKYGGDVENTLLGDPALLLPLMIPKKSLIKNSQMTNVCIIPHFLDKSKWHMNNKKYTKLSLNHYNWLMVIKSIVNSEMVLTSSLHAAIIADAYGIPVAVVESNEPAFKFYDYFYSINSSRKLLSNKLPISEIMQRASNCPEINMVDLLRAVDKLKKHLGVEE